MLRSQFRLGSIARHVVWIGAVGLSTPLWAQQAPEGWKVGGAIRARYDYAFDTKPTRSEFSFDTLMLNLKYNSSTVFGSAQYRFYEYYGHIGDTNYLQHGYVGYKFNDQHQVIAGLNQVPFGLQPYFGSTFYEGIANPLGLEDVHNLGIKYKFANGPWDVQLAYYAKDGGHYTGESKDSARYSINLVSADSYIPNGVNNSEKNMFVGRVAHTVKHSDKSSSEIGVSSLRSDVHNEDTGEDGSRAAHAVHYKGVFGQWGAQFQVGKLDIKPRNPLGNNSIVTVGGFDGSFNTAAKGNLYVAEVSYDIPKPFWEISGAKVYANYSVFKKSQAGFKDSSRIVLGSSFSLAKLYIATEMLIGKHDPYIGSDYVNNLAQGGASDSWHKHFYANIGYYF